MPSSVNFEPGGKCPGSARAENIPDVAGCFLNFVFEASVFLKFLLFFGRFSVKERRAIWRGNVSSVFFSEKKNAREIQEIIVVEFGQLSQVIFSECPFKFDLPVLSENPDKYF